MANDYQRRFNTTQEVIISAICGEGSMNQEISKMLRDQRVKKYILKIFSKFLVIS